MSIAGKILAIFNVLAAIAFIVVAGMDWGQRERWSYAVYRHDLLVDGLPIDAQELGPDLKPRVDKFDAPWFAAMFQRAGGKPVKTVTDEVNDVQRQVTAPGTPPAKLAQYLHALARTFSERDRYARIAAGQAEAKEEDLQKELAAHFDTVKETSTDPGTSAPHKHSNEERRVNAARLLFCLGDAMPENPGADFLASQPFQRLVLVCGLSAAAQAIDDQAQVILAMTDQAMRVHHAELNQFVYDHGQRVYANRNLADEADRLNRTLQAKQADVEQQKQLVTERRVEIKRLTDQLSTLRQETAKNLEQQARQEEEVMRRLVELRNTARSNQELERQIRELEGVK
jgi:methyl-accepting chemotaxis protein